MRDHQSEYVAALCHVRNGEIEAYESSHFDAVDGTEAVRRAREWALSLVEFLPEPTWLQVEAGGRGVHTLRLI